LLFISHVVEKALLQLKLRQSLLVFLVLDIQDAYNNTIEFVQIRVKQVMTRRKSRHDLSHKHSSTNIKKTILKDYAFSGLLI